MMMVSGTFRIISNNAPTVASHLFICSSIDFAYLKNAKEDRTVLARCNRPIYALMYIFIETNSCSPTVLIVPLYEKEKTILKTNQSNYL